MGNGIIKQCVNRGSECHFKCCNFTTNFIVLYPGEYEESNLNKSHLKIIDENYHGGKKAVCTRLCAPGDFKPLDCKTYPFFPVIDSNNTIRLIKGSKCPLTNSELTRHKAWVMNTWIKLFRNEQIREWVKKVKLIGYESFHE